MEEAKRLPSKRFSHQGYFCNHPLRCVLKCVLFGDRTDPHFEPFDEFIAVAIPFILFVSRKNSKFCTLFFQLIQ